MQIGRGNHEEKYSNRELSHGVPEHSGRRCDVRCKVFVADLERRDQIGTTDG